VVATLNDAYNQLVEANAQLTTLRSDVQEVNASVQAGTAATEAGFSQMASLVGFTNQLLGYEIEQNHTIICNLEKIAKQTCELVNQAVLQTAAQEAMRGQLADLRQLYELSNPAAAVEQHRLEALNRKIEACCPPPVAPPPCHYEPCKSPGPPPDPGPVIQ
jgi:microcompartment protein CcmL/EutN